MKRWWLTTSQPSSPWTFTRTHAAAHHSLIVNGDVPREVIEQGSGELLGGALPRRILCRVPALVVNAPDQHRQLSAQVRYLLNLKAITHLVQAATQSKIGPDGGPPNAVPP
jgi:hypothetical protein